MAYIKCPHCGEDVLDTAVECDRCGYTLKTEWYRIVIINKGAIGIASAWHNIFSTDISNEQLRKIEDDGILWEGSNVTIAKQLKNAFECNGFILELLDMNNNPVVEKEEELPPEIDTSEINNKRTYSFNYPVVDVESMVTFLKVASFVIWGIGFFIGIEKRKNCFIRDFGMVWIF